MRFTNKVIWITGATYGIGKHLAKKQSKKGAKLIISSRKTQALKTVKQSCKKPEKVKLIQMDLENYNNFEYTPETTV